MEDNSYVSLSLEKYNELYDKAKKYDELVKTYGDKVAESVGKLVDSIDKMLSIDEEETEQEVEDTEFKVGDKVKLIKLNDCTYGFNIGDVCTITGLNDNGGHHIVIDNKESKGYVDEENIEKIKEEK